MSGCYRINFVGFEVAVQEIGVKHIDVFKNKQVDGSYQLYYAPSTSEKLVQTFAGKFKDKSFNHLKDTFLSKCGMKCKISEMSTTFKFIFIIETHFYFLHYRSFLFVKEEINLCM